MMLRWTVLPDSKRIRIIRYSGLDRCWFVALDAWVPADPPAQRPEWVEIVNTDGDEFEPVGWSVGSVVKVDGWDDELEHPRPVVKAGPKWQPDEPFKLHWAYWVPADPPPPEPEPLPQMTADEWCDALENGTLPPVVDMVVKHPPADPPVVPAPPVRAWGEEPQHVSAAPEPAAASPTVLVEPSDADLGRAAYSAWYGALAWDTRTQAEQTKWIAAVVAVRDALAVKEDRL